MSNIKYISEKISKGESVYLYDDYEDAVFKFTGTGQSNYCSVKFRGKSEYEIKCSTNLACQAFLGGEIITKEEYDKF